MPIDDSLVNEVLKHADIVKIISSYLSVTKKGKNYVAICPFHDDSNPSLTISPEKQIFKCFVCGTGGSAITFVQKYEHISFMEALRKVAELSGFHSPLLEQRVYKKPVDEKKVPLFKCLHDLTVFYQYSLSTSEGKDGLAYFESRNLDSSLRSKYMLGYANRDGKATVKYLQNKGNSLKTIDDIGVASIANGVYSDKNQGRVIFPICDKDGQVIGFSARRIKDGPEAKYINSPETYLFHKSNILYNYHIAKEAAKIKGYIYVLEGFMDVFALGRIKEDAAVALMGTALTNEHIAMLRALNVEIRLCLDGDLAGQTAMMKASKSLELAGLNFRIVDNQGSVKDPDEILNTDGADSLKAYLNNLLSRVDFALNYFLRSNPLKTIEEKKKLLQQFIPILLKIRSQLEFDDYLRKLSKITGFDVESIRTVVIEARRKENFVDPGKVIESFHPERKALRRLEIAEREVLYQMINNKAARAFYEKNIGGFYDETYRQVANFIIEYASTHDDLEVSSIVASLEMSDLSNKDELIKELTNISLEQNHPQTCTVELLNNLLDSINEEKEKIFENDTLTQSLEGKGPLEQARIISEYNRRKVKKDRNK